ncbi:MAG: NAD(P)-binding domain-containing protein [Gammaproteobacteria bacterium]|nr:NAD(P)-binding domain-containing protein [Gammaproteobacteria bacterium]
MTPISILGLGAMGQALASHFLARGHAVTVWNRTRGKASALVARGANETASVSDAITAGELLVVCVLDYAAVESILATASAALPGHTLVNLTNGTPAQARALAEQMRGLGAHYLDGGIMATPPMIGGEHAVLLYSGEQSAFDAYAETLASLGAAHYVGADAGLASLHDLALLSGMYGLFSGFLHASAMVESAGIGATRFLAQYLASWLTAMMGVLPGLADRIDSGVHTHEVISKLDMQLVALDNILTATREQGVATDLLDPLLALLQRRSAGGHGDDDLSGVHELIRRRSERWHTAREH